LRPRNIGFCCDVSGRRKSGMFFRNPFAPIDRGHPQRTGHASIAGTQQRSCDEADDAMKRMMR